MKHSFSVSASLNPLASGEEEEGLTGAPESPAPGPAAAQEPNQILERKLAYKKQKERAALKH